MDKYVQLVVSHLCDNWNIWSQDAQYDTETLIERIAQIFGVDKEKLESRVSVYLTSHGLNYREVEFSEQEVSRAS